jgi:hypothetical protein
MITRSRRLSPISSDNDNNNGQIDSHDQTTPQLEQLPVGGIATWIGPVSFTSTVAFSIWFIPVAWAFFLGFAIFVIVEASLATYKATWLRPSTIIQPVADTGHRWFDRLGAGVAAIFDVVWWLDAFWTFLRRILPLDTLWGATVQLITVIIHLITVPVSFVVGIARGIVNSRNPGLSVILCFLAIALVSHSIYQQIAPWEVVYSIITQIIAVVKKHS